MATGSWQHHLGRALLAAAAVLAVAWLSGEPVTVIAIALAALLLWHAVNAWRLNAWLNSGAREPPRSLGLWSDLFNHITELKNRNRLQAEQLQELSREFEGMTDAFPDAVIVIDDDDRLTGINDAARLLLGLRIPDDLGRPVTNLLRGSDFANWLAVQDRVESRLEIPCPGDSTVHLCISAMKYRQGQRLLILLDTTDPDEVIRTVVAIAPSFGGIQLEDIAAPECFEIESALVERLDKPVLHDDQHGTAVVTLAALINACERVGRELSDSVVGQVGLGAAGIGIARLLLSRGTPRILGADLNPDVAGAVRSDIQRLLCGRGGDRERNRGRRPGRPAGRSRPT